MPLPAVAPLSLSQTTITAAAECPRRAWLLGPGAWQGWPGGLRAREREASLAYEGKHVWPVPMALGQIVHRVAERQVRAVVLGRRQPPASEIFEEMRWEMNALRRRPLEAFVARPKLGMLLPKYLGLTIPADEVERTRIKMQAAARRLLGAAVLDDLRGIDPRDLVSVEQLFEMPLAVDGLPVATVYGKADLIYRARTTLHVPDSGFIAPGPDGIPVMVDWKTARAPLDGPVVRRQMALLALLARHTGIRPHPVAGYVARIIDLSPGGVQEEAVWLIGAGEIAEARGWLVRELARLAGLPRDDHGVILRDATEARRGCRCCEQCVVQRACELSFSGTQTVEVQQRAGSPPPAAP